MQVNFTLDRPNGDTLPSPKAYAYGHDLLPGKTWEFKTLPVSRNTTYRFDEITAY